VAYGCQASLDHAVAKLDRTCARMTEAQKENRARGHISDEQLMIGELANAIAYVADAVRYLKDGVP
jgi:hypothetical protein